MSDYRCVSDSSSRGHEFDPSPVPYFRGGILKKSADENKSMLNYPACNELSPSKPNCYELTPFQPNCFVLNAFNVCCRYSSVIQTSQKFIMIMEAITLNPDQTDPKGAILSRSFAIFDT